MKGEKEYAGGLPEDKKGVIVARKGVITVAGEGKRS